ncbi:MAG: DHH family phosphoesterase [Thermoplasmata archaeon]|nr:MAG: DHH family phosphoesterase [Thermoplasmata archaeon]
MDQKSLLEKIIKKLASKEKKCVLLHVNADPDALGCAVALSLAFPEITIGSAGGLSKNGKNLQKNLDVEVIEHPDISIFNTIIAVDTPSPERLGEYGENLSNLIVIDHHLKTHAWETELCYIDENVASCGEIVYEILKLAEKKITSKIGLALLAGILTDTGKFSYAKASTLTTFAKIMEASGISMDDVLSVFEEEHETDYSKRISRLKGAQRMRYTKVGRYIVAVSQVGSFESSVCGTLLSLGADCAFVGSQRENEFRISARATSAIIKEGLHLGNLMDEIGKENGCDGGGHDGAAGLAGIGDVEAMLNICIERLKGGF